MIQTSKTISCAQGKLRAIVGDHFMVLPAKKVSISALTGLLDANGVLKAGKIVTANCTAPTYDSETGTSDAKAVVYKDVATIGVQEDTVQVSLFVHGALYESEVAFNSDATTKAAEKAALNQILFV